MVGAAASVASMRCACLCVLGVNVHRDAWMQRGGRTEGRRCGGVRRFDVLGRCGRARERGGGPTVWRLWGGGRLFWSTKREPPRWPTDSGRNGGLLCTSRRGHCPQACLCQIPQSGPVWRHWDLGETLLRSATERGRR